MTTTFVVRLYPPERPVDPVDLRGVVESVSTGDATVFRSGAELLDVLSGSNGPAQELPS